MESPRLELREMQEWFMHTCIAMVMDDYIFKGEGQDSTVDYFDMEKPLVLFVLDPL